jgi:hypothetical protein
MHPNISHKIAGESMTKVAIVSDSTISEPKHLLDELDIHTVLY